MGTRQTVIEYNIVDAAGKISAVSSYTLNFAEALPVVFGTIEAKIFEDNLLINWQTVEERGCDRFEIEASLNGIDFKKIGEIKSKAPGGNSDQLLAYEFKTSLSTQIMAWAAAAFIITAFLLMFNKRNRWIYAVLLITSVGIGVAGCDKRNNNESEEYNKTLHIRVVQIDIDGTKHYSKVVRAQQ